MISLKNSMNPTSVIAASAFRYGNDGRAQPDATGPVVRTFKEALASTRGDCHLAIVRGANHFSPTYPPDSATGRPFLDWPTTRTDDTIRKDIAELITLFARTYVVGDTAARLPLQALLDDDSRVQLTGTR